MDEYEEKIDKIDDKINSSLFNIRERIDYLINERTKTINIIDRLEVNKKKLRTKIIMTIVSIICFGISLTIDNFNVVSVISFVTSIKCISITILNIISNKKKRYVVEFRG